MKEATDHYNEATTTSTEYPTASWYWYPSGPDLPEEMLTVTVQVKPNVDVLGNDFIFKVSKGKSSLIFFSIKYLT